MPEVSVTVPVNTNNDPAVNIIPEEYQGIYLDMLLSEYYGKMVRQGNSFCVTGIQASLVPNRDSAGIDIGMSAQVELDYIPTNSHTRKAWNNVFKNWKQQKNLSTAYGSQIRYDDMEFGWDAEIGGGEGAGARGRTSTIASALTDTALEKLVLTGPSVQTSGTTVGTFSLQDYYNSAYQTPEASLDPFTNSPIKEPKWGDNPYPPEQTLNCSATSSAQWFDSAGANIHQGAITMGPIEKLPVDAHVMCGIMRAKAFIMPDDTIGQLEDDFDLTITIFVKSWKSLVHKTKSYSRRGRSSRRTSRGYKSNYRSYRGKRRRR